MRADFADIVVVGGGPAGMAAATQAAALGASVVLLDEQPTPGGQIYRAVKEASAARLDVLGPDYAAGRTLVDAFERSQATHIGRAAVWQITAQRTVHYLRNGEVATLKAGRIVLCTGAMERPFPIPGWTLPGVLTAGAAQILLKTADTVPSAPVVLAGCGPLLYLLASQYVRAGVRVAAIVDTTDAADKRRALSHLGGALAGWRYLAKGLAMMRELRRAGVPFHQGASALAVEGDEGDEGSRDEKVARALSFVANGRRERIESPVILLHQGVVPNTQFTWSLRAAHRWSDSQLAFVPVTDAWGELDVPGIHVAGDGAGIGGAIAAALGGRIAALGAGCALGHVDTHMRDRLAAPLRRALAPHLRVRPFLEALYRPKTANRIPADGVVICRCEEVTAGTLREHVSLGCTGPNQAKSFGRCGMGPCQGRLCGLTVTEIIADARGVSPSETGYYRIRPPIKPITLGELAREA
ncbi:NAD(P)/FAD-dependent oxidoreductase [Trinickia caryophylli]|uniref:NADPH-dependent 2,4-dienoyl-CoA reductase, sulfur reductase n=1 Tax=Trinickia caryophylli TaxID=28094 RepID=A0A1X7DIC0_TRICW|nr:NAD(P)/FAD-dependent oxidoreductase [Trinickia caryophylli]PMS12316.1 FAD-dependent oxidoreductase [Trinickia caryophylli]TRX17011.1 FAD-dependent oxidoreductase [Trinickia caryophylli]WQE12249.1 NAD(P)/FAD-dependent oxidoreductase [Trinickia caryophylli]SMF15705.1 NADPH-dependent 2,4-dienoyl-CoA reductase, sulfur reductase [Trinickia caryophylli]GLU31609.1 (2Fe-2S)-binding protein [Trinickia caryophylli]